MNALSLTENDSDCIKDFVLQMKAELKHTTEEKSKFYCFDFEAEKPKFSNQRFIWDEKFLEAEEPTQKDSLRGSRSSFRDSISTLSSDLADLEEIPEVPKLKSTD